MGKIIPNANVTMCGLSCATSFSRKYIKSSPYPVEGMIQRTATAVSIVATAAKKVTHPASPNAPHVSFERSYIPESSPTMTSFRRSDGFDFRRRESIGLLGMSVSMGDLMDNRSGVVDGCRRKAALLLLCLVSVVGTWKEDASSRHCSARQNNSTSLDGVMIMCDARRQLQDLNTSNFKEGRFLLRDSKNFFQKTADSRPPQPQPHSATANQNHEECNADVEKINK
eukprot:scaffold28848_cov25-Cyclotella_meneghiniana.AAC.1